MRHVNELLDFLYKYMYNVTIEKEKTMPIISSLYGIIIKMYFIQNEHNPPHFHAFYNEHVGVIDINTGKVDGSFDVDSILIHLDDKWLWDEIPKVY